MSQVDLIPIKDLWLKYSLGRTQFYSRLRELGIVPEKIGNQGFITPEQLEVLDNLHQHILKGGNTPTFLSEVMGVESETRAIVKSSSSSIARKEQIPVDLAFRMFEMFEAPQDPLLPQRQLQEAADQGWILGTAQLKEILGFRPREGTILGFEIVRFGRSGRGVETGWKIKRI